MDSNALPRLGANRSDPRQSDRDSEVKPKDSGGKIWFPLSRSQSLTPRVPMTPIGTGVVHLKEASLDAKPLAKLLQQFSHGIVSISSHGNRQDSTARTQRRLRREDQKWRDRYEIFAPLAEVRQRGVGLADKKFARSDKKLHSIKTDHRANTEQIATSLALGGIMVPATKDADDVKSKQAFKDMKEELDRVVKSLDEVRSDNQKLRGELERTTTSLNHSKPYANQIKAVVTTQSNVQKDLDEFRRMLKDLNDFRLASIESQKKAEERIVSISNQIGTLENSKKSTDLSARLGNLEKKIQSQDTILAQFGAQSVKLQTLQTSHEDLNLKINDFKATLDQEVAELTGLKEVVSGDTDSDGLLDMIATAQNDDQKFQKVLEAFNETMDGLEESVKNLNGKIAGVDEGKSRLEIRLNALEDERPSNGLISDDVAIVKTGLSAFEERYKLEQEEKDDNVATEVERLDSILISQDNAIKQLTGQMRDSLAKPQEDLEVQRLKGNLPSSRLTNGASVVGDLNPHKAEELESKHNIIKKEVDSLQSNFEQFKTSTTDVTNSHETFITNLQHRFDNLTTDHMVRCIIHQMSILYPQHPAHIQNQITAIQQPLSQLMGNQTHFDQSLQRIQGQLNAVDQRINPQIQAKCDKVQALLIERIETEKRQRLEGQRISMEALDRRLKHLAEGQQTGQAENCGTILADVQQRLKDHHEEQEIKRSQDRGMLMLDIEQRLKAHIDGQETMWSGPRTNVLAEVEQRLKDLTEQQEAKQSQNREVILADIEQRLRDLTEGQEAKQNQSREAMLTDIGQRLKDFTEEQQESMSKVKQDIESHLSKIQSLQNSRTETSINSLNKELQDLQKSLESTHHDVTSNNTSQQKLTQDLRKALESARSNCASDIDKLSKNIESLQDMVQNQIPADTDKLRIIIMETQAVWLRDMPHHYRAISEINIVCGLTNDHLNGNISDEDRIPDVPSAVFLRDMPHHYAAISALNKRIGLNNKVLDGEVPDNDHSPDAPTGAARPRSPSMSLGQPSSPPRPPSRDSASKVSPNHKTGRVITAPTRDWSREGSYGADERLVSRGPLTLSKQNSAPDTSPKRNVGPKITPLTRDGSGGKSKDSSAKKSSTPSMPDAPPKPSPKGRGKPRNPSAPIRNGNDKRKETPTAQRCSTASSQTISSRPSTGTGTKEAPLTLSQSTDGQSEDSDVPISGRGKRKKKPTKKSEESPIRLKKVNRTG